MYNQIDSNKRNTAILMGLFLIFIIGLGFVFSYALESQWILIVAVIIAIVQVLVSYYYSDSITLAISGAKEVTHDDNKELYHLLENLCITAGLPQPKLYIINDSAPNAFATGRDPNHAIICVTSGLLEKMDKNELQGVLAHELSHIGNYDTRLMTIVVVLVGVVALLSDLFLRTMFWGGGRRRSSSSGGGGAQAVIMIIAIVFAVLAPLIAMFIKLAISRKREYLADATGVSITRYPEGLASALEKISRDPEPLEAANKATAHLYIENPLKDHKKSWFNSLFDTHPPAEERIKKLREMA
ncbi:MAG: zinc metalloprotease HtpX [Armatimonadota bacterium]